MHIAITINLSSLKIDHSWFAIDSSFLNAAKMWLIINKKCYKDNTRFFKLFMCFNRHEKFLAVLRSLKNISLYWSRSADMNVKRVEFRRCIKTRLKQAHSQEFLKDLKSLHLSHNMLLPKVRGYTLGMSTGGTDFWSYYFGDPASLLPVPWL